MLVLLLAVAVYVLVPAPSQRDDTGPALNTGVPTVGTMVTVWSLVLGPLQPAALAVIMLVPFHPDT